MLLGEMLTKYIDTNERHWSLAKHVRSSATVILGIGGGCVLVATWPVDSPMSGCQMLLLVYMSTTRNGKHKLGKHRCPRPTANKRWMPPDIMLDECGLECGLHP